MGKGSTRRPQDDKKFAVNFDRIFNKKKDKNGDKPNSKNFSTTKKTKF